MPTLHVQLLGNFQLRYGDAPVTGFTTARLQSLLAYLLLHRHEAQMRSQLAFLFWPDSTDSQAYANLRQMLRTMRQALPDAPLFLSITGKTVQWRPDGPFTLDVAQFEAAAVHAKEAVRPGNISAQRHVLERAIELYDVAHYPRRGILLPECYEDWVQAERERLHQVFTGVVEQLVGVLDEQADYSTAITYCQRLLRHDPAHEITYQRLMRMYSLNGDRTGALRTYQTCITALQQELGVQPGRETQAVYERYVHAGGTVSPATAFPVQPGKTHQHNLPAPITSFIGRERQIAEVKRLLGRSRLVTLTGVGGTGKSRLALQIAVEIENDLPGSPCPRGEDGVWLVDLSPLSDATLVIQAIATVLGVQEERNSPLHKTLLESLRTQNLLLVLDNCEHLVAACARAAETILQNCPHVKILASSREALGLTGEMVFNVPSLALPDPGQSLEADRLLEFEAVKLFVERAGTVKPDFAVTPQILPTVAEICYRLDGIPLAIELAAARVKTMPVDQIAHKLDDRFHLLTGGSRTAMPRQQTLQSLIDWSYDLLWESERILLRRLSTFSGGWTLIAAETVCAGNGLEAYEVLDLLTHLVDKSLVMADPMEGDGRYRLLETIRQYAREKLRASGEEEPVRTRHLQYFLRLAEEGEIKLRGAEQITWLRRLEAEHDNMRGALQWSLVTEPGSPRIAELGLRLAGALGWFWFIRGYWQEGWEWLNKHLAHAEPPGRTRARAKALWGASYLALTLDLVQRDRVKCLLEESVDIGRETGDQWTAAWALQILGQRAVADGDMLKGRSLYAESEALFREVADKWGLAWTLLAQGLSFINSKSCDYQEVRALLKQSADLFRELGDKMNLTGPISHLGTVDRLEGDLPSARSRWMERLAIDKELGNIRSMGTSLWTLGSLAREQGDYRQAVALFEEGLAVARAQGRKHEISRNLLGLGTVACLQGDFRHAQDLLKECLKVCREINYDIGIPWVLCEFAAIAEAQGQPVRAAKLLRVDESRYGSLNRMAQIFHHERYERLVEKLRAQLGQATFEAATAQGQEMTVEAAIEYTLKEDVLE